MNTNTPSSHNQYPGWNDRSDRSSRWNKLKDKILKFYNYCVRGVWTDRRDNWKVNTVKTLNLTVRSIFDSDLQGVACAMTYRTVLALVPMLAMAFAICRGFGFENLLTNQLYNFFPSQRQLLSTSLKFVDSYLAQASEGIFVGVGVVFLLWTVISLLSSVEQSFNKIWNVKHDRTLYRQITDYLGIMLILPVLIICSSGITVVLDTTLKRLLPFDFLTPALTLMFEGLSFLLIVLFFAAAYMMIPNTKVRFGNAFFSGLLAATAYSVLQWIFVTGQMYVAKYNAIYGSFSFLPLLLIWLQLVWLFTLIGAEICYASQNFSRFDYHTQSQKMSITYSLQLSVAVAAVIVRRFESGEAPVTPAELSRTYGVPLGIVEKCYSVLIKDGVIIETVGSDGRPDGRAIPSHGMSEESVGDLLSTLISAGDTDFIEGLDIHFPRLRSIMSDITAAISATGSKTLLSSLGGNESNE